MAEAVSFRAFNLLRPTAPRYTPHHVSIFCGNCKSLIVKDEDIVGIRATEHGPEVLAKNCEGSQLHPIGFALDHALHTQSMQRQGYLDAEIVKQKVICRCFYESEQVEEYYKMKEYRVGYILFNKKHEEDPYYDSFRGCVIRYGLNGGSRLEWTGDQSANALLNYEDGKLMGKWSKKDITAPPSGVQEFLMSNIKEFHLLSTLSATVKGSLHHVSLHCKFCLNVLVRPDQIAHISVKERGDRIIWTRASPSDPDGAVTKNLKLFGKKKFNKINTQRMQDYNYWKTTIMTQNVMCKCRYVPRQSFDFLRRYSIGYQLFDMDPNGVGFLDLDCDYRLTFRFCEEAPATRCIMWAGDQSRNSVRSTTLVNIPVEIETQLVVTLVKERLLSFSEDEDEEQEEFKALLQKMVERRTCSKSGADFDIQAKETAELLEEVQEERAAERVKINQRCNRAMSSQTGTCKHYQVILVGEPGAGKTSFRRAVMGEDFLDELDSTEGISVVSTSAELTNPTQQDINFQQSLPDGILVNAFTGHLLAVAQPHLGQAAKSTDHLMHLSESTVIAGPTDVAVSSDAEVFSSPEQATLLESGPSPLLEGAPSPLRAADQTMYEDTAHVAKHLRLSEASLKRIHHAKAQLEQNLDKTFVRFVDCGGHLSFLSTQTVCFGTKNTLYGLAFDASLPLFEVGNEAFRKRGSSSPQGARMRLSHIDYVMYWLNNIVTVGFSGAMSTQAAKEKPLVILLATHIDMVSDRDTTMAKVKTEISERIIESNLEEKLCILGPLFIDNRHSKSDKACAASEMLKVQETLCNEIEKRTAAVEVPLAWLVLDVVLDQRQNTFPVLTVNDFLSLPEVAEAVQSSQEEGLDKMLAHLRDVGRIHFLSGGKDWLGGQRLLFLKPGWLVQEITKVIVCSMQQPDQQTSQPRRDVKKLKEKGILTKELYSSLWQHHSSNVQQELLRVMELYGLQAPIYQCTETDHEDNIPVGHWVPSCLELESDKPNRFSSAVKCAFEVPPMLLTIDDFFVPLYVYTRLTAYLLQEYKPLHADLASDAAQFVCSSRQQGTFYHAHVSYVDRGIRLGFLCTDREVALGNLRAVPNIGLAAQQFCSNVCKILQRIIGKENVQLEFRPLFACPSSPVHKQTWIKMTLPVELPIENTVSEDDIAVMQLDTHHCEACLTAHKLPANWLAWFGWFDQQESRNEPQTGVLQPDIHHHQLPMAMADHCPVPTSLEQRSPNVFGTAASQPSQMISAKARTAVASDMPSLVACRALAAELKFSNNALMKLNKFEGMTAHQMLDDWYKREAENATGRVLYNALCAIGLKSIADEYKGILLDTTASQEQPLPAQTRPIDTSNVLVDELSTAFMQTSLTSSSTSDKVSTTVAVADGNDKTSSQAQPPTSLYSSEHPKTADTKDVSATVGFSERSRNGGKASENGEASSFQSKAEKGGEPSATCQTQLEDQQLAWRRKEITRDHMFALEKTSAASCWKGLGRRLHNEEKPERPYAFGRADLSEIEGTNRRDPDRLTDLIERWTEMSDRHTIGHLYDAMLGADLQHAAVEVFGEHPML